MCIPSPPNPAPAVVPTPTDAAASAFDLGGNQAGANIGRLALRLTSGNSSSGTSNSSPLTGSQATAPPAAPSASAPAGSTQAAAAAPNGNTSNPGAFGAAQRGGFSYTPNQNIRVA